MVESCLKITLEIQTTLELRPPDGLYHGLALLCRFNVLPFMWPVDKRVRTFENERMRKITLFFSEIKLLGFN